MDIAALSMDMAAAKFQMDAGFAIARKVMESSEINAAGLVEMMEAAAPAIPAEHIIDVKA